MKELKEYIQQIKNNTEAHISINDMLSQTFVINPINLKYLCELALRQLEVCELKHCEKHNQYFYDYVPSCPICYGETLDKSHMLPPDIHENHPDVIQEKNNERKDRFKRDMKDIVLPKIPVITIPAKAEKKKPKTKGFF